MNDNIDKKKRARAYNRLGDNYLHKGLLDEAVRAYTKATQCDPSFSIPHNNIGIVYIEQKKYAEAIEELKNAILLDPDEAIYYSNLSSAYSEAGMSDIALEANLVAIETNPNDYHSHFNLGCSYQARGKFEAALEHYRKATELKPNFAQGFVSMGTMYSFLSRSPVRALRRKQPDVCYDVNPKVGQALAAFTKALELDPKCERAYFQMGLLYKDTAHYEKATEAFKKLIALNSKSEDAEIAMRYIDEIQKLDK